MQGQSAIWQLHNHIVMLRDYNDNQIFLFPKFILSFFNRTYNSCKNHAISFMIKAKKGLERNEQRKNNILKNLHKIYQTSKKIWLKKIVT